MAVTRDVLYDDVPPPTEEPPPDDDGWDEEPPWAEVVELGERVVIGPRYEWRTYRLDDGTEAVACYIDGRFLHHDQQGWYVNVGFDPKPERLPEDLIAELRGTAPPGEIIHPEHLAAAIPEDVATLDPAILNAVAAEYGLTGPEAWKLASDIASRVHSEQAYGTARRIVHEAQLVRDADLNSLTPLTAHQLITTPRPPRLPVFGKLVNEGHNATVVARWKVGKSTFVDNMAAAATTATPFLGQFVVAEPLRVTLFNYELYDEDMADRIQALNLPGDALNRLTIINLRGRRLPLTTDTGRNMAARWLADAGTQVVIVDPFGAAFAAAGGQSENDNAEVRRFLIALDEIKRLAGVHTLIMPVHTGRATNEEGDEQGRGATVLEDWPDNRILLTKDTSTNRRFIRTEGRALELQESALTYDDTTRRLTLDNAHIGINRKRSRVQEGIDYLVKALEETPGVNRTEVRRIVSEAVAKNSDGDQVVQDAKARRFIHVHPGPRNTTLHYPGEPHPIDDECPGGWNP